VDAEEGRTVRRCGDLGLRRDGRMHPQQRTRERERADAISEQLTHDDCRAIFARNGFHVSPI
jgi:hypothetical protein